MTNMAIESLASFKESKSRELLGLGNEYYHYSIYLPGQSPPIESG